MFCTNEEMALRATDPQTTGDTVVIGAPGIQEARDLIAGGASHLRATVVQDPHLPAESAVEVLQRMLDGRRTVKRTTLRSEVYRSR